MKIHITEANQRISDIAKAYEIDEEIIRNINEIDCGEPAVGEELLIIKPTRTYKLQCNDSIERIAIRFGIQKREIYLMNPHLIGREPKIGEKIILRTGERTYGMMVANGYFHKGCTEDLMIRALPYLTYVTFASAVADKGGITKTFDDKKLVKRVADEGKTPLIRIYDRCIDQYKEKDNYYSFAEELIKVAKEGGYKGIVLNTIPHSDSAEKFVSFLMVLRKLMIGCDLILITEINEKSPYDFSEYADGSLLYYPKFATNNAPDFTEGERKVLSDFACNAESAKTFVDIPALARMNDSFISINEALKTARKKGYTITKNKSTLLSHFNDRWQGDCRFLSLQGLKDIFELIHEFDYMGVCFDIMRTPIAHYLMYNSLFKSSYSASVSSREGCSREVVE